LIFGYLILLINPQKMANLNTKAMSETTYDAIVIGSGASGGWAAKELCEN